MMNIRPGNARGRFDYGWLDTRHTFSFADYHDRQHMGFHALRVINEDRIAPSGGFPSHAHRDMEIITVVLEGALQHQDSMGTGSVIVAGDVQMMTAGTGVTHSEKNPSSTVPVHLLQIWIIPDRIGLPPQYQQRNFSTAESPGKMILIASPDGREQSLVVHQNMTLHRANLRAGDQVEHRFAPQRAGWLQLMRGDVTVDGESLHAGDGGSISNQELTVVKASTDAEFLLFDLA